MTLQSSLVPLSDEDIHKFLPPFIQNFRETNPESYTEALERQKRLILEYGIDAFIESHAKKAASDLHKEIITASKKAPEQGSLFQWCSYPTNLTRTSFFFPKGNHVPRQKLNNVVISSSGWGEISFTGTELRTEDEDILVCLLTLLENANYRKTEQVPDTSKNKTSFKTTYFYRGPSSKILDLLGYKKDKRGKYQGNHYKSLNDSLAFLHEAQFTLKISRAKGAKRRKLTDLSHILSKVTIDEDTGELVVVFDPYFYECYLQGYITPIDAKTWFLIRGRVAKALYRFVMSHRKKTDGNTTLPVFEGHFLTLASALNIDINNQEHKQVKRLVKEAIKELTELNILEKRTRFVNKDILHIYRSPKAELNRPQEGQG